MKIRALFTTLLLASLLAACVGSSSLQLATGGIGGTGIAAGPSTAFGSIFVNGVEYDIDQATLTRNGLPATGQNDYRIGEYVTIKGTVNAEGLTGTATEVLFSNEVEGTVTSLSNDGVTIGIMGQMVRVNDSSVFHGFQQLSELMMGNVVEVSGVRDAQNALVAASITLERERYAEGETLELKGIIQQLDPVAKTFQMDGLIVDYALAALEGFDKVAPANGQYVEAKTQQALQGNRLLAYKVELEDEHDHFGAGTKVELEGVITRFVSATDFTVNRQVVMTDANTQFEDGSARNLAQNVLVEVEGETKALGILVAKEVSIKSK